MMKTRTFLLASLLFFTFSGFASCSVDDPEPVPDAGQPVSPEKPGEQDDPKQPGNHEGDDNHNDNPMNNQLKITVGTSSFSVTLADNATAAAFKALLPMTLEMSEMNGNEKYDYLAEDLPTAASNPGSMQAGDLMLYGSFCVVLFYESFRTSYSYTRIGRVDDASGLAAALGKGNASVTFEINENQ